MAQGLNLDFLNLLNRFIGNPSLIYVTFPVPINEKDVTVPIIFLTRETSVVRFLSKINPSLKVVSSVRAPP